MGGLGKEWRVVLLALDTTLQASRFWLQASRLKKCIIFRCLKDGPRAQQLPLTVKSLALSSVLKARYFLNRIFPSFGRKFFDRIPKFADAYSE